MTWVLLIPLLILAGGVWWWDTREHRIPNRLILMAAPVALIAVLFTCGFLGGSWAWAGVGFVAFALFFGALSYVTLGMGDVKLALLLGPLVGTCGPVALLTAIASMYALALLWAIVLVVRARAVKGVEMPFGPSMVTGAVIAVIMASTTL